MAQPPAKACAVGDGGPGAQGEGAAAAAAAAPLAALSPGLAAGVEGTMESLLCVNDIMRCISTSRGLLRRRWAALERRLRALVKGLGFWAGDWVWLGADVAMVIRRIVVEAGG